MKLSSSRRPPASASRVATLLLPLLTILSASARVAATSPVDTPDAHPPIAQPTPLPQIPQDLLHHAFDPALVKRQAPASGSSSTVVVPGTAAAGGLSYTLPAATAAASYYKIMESNPITFGWNFTSLYVQPSSLTFVAYCSANSFTYPVGPTNGIPGTDTSLVWDPYAYQQSSPNAIPFAQASYTLRVYDERGIDAVATPGYFYGTNTIVNFALYSPAPYTSLSDGWKCVACSSAMRTMADYHHILVALPITVALILIGGAGVLGR